MSWQICLSHLDKSGAACLTLVWLLSRVDAGVGLEVGWSIKLGTTDVAVVGFCTWRSRSAGGAMNKNSHIHEVSLMVFIMGKFKVTCVNGLVAGQVAFVAEGSLAAVTLVWLVAVDLDHVVFKGIFLYELGVTPITEVGVVFCGEKH